MDFKAKASQPLPMAKGQSTTSALGQLSYLLLPWGKESPGCRGWKECKGLSLPAAAPQEMPQVHLRPSAANVLFLGS